ncbi:hypothetical protein M2336_001663 [Sphingobium sp. B1D7B]|uniref:hypothetical protein n=1 Tax=Sphingobium sp. B1D7B TaxID=2940578 RepID=UPI00222564D5|nr:hypothetical protein [Sphingobium sp. B1D7B]MCW2405034.1 hypothetical protein [Sphingobium sp. B1D7B]
MTYDPTLRKDMTRLRYEKANASKVGGLATALKHKVGRAEVHGILDASQVGARPAPDMAQATPVNQWTDYLRFRSAFAKLLDERFYPLAWLDQEVASGSMVLLSKDDSAILVSIKAYPSGLKEIHGECATGKLDVIASDLIPLAEQFGREIGCEFGAISSRKGWDRVMRDQGYSVHQTTLRKAL